jgi:N-acetylmuramoyl-L-alanine amidase
MLFPYTTKEVDLLARLMRAEAVGEGELGMLMVGNVAVNRVLANCLDFKLINTVTKMVYQSPGGFSAVNSPLFYSTATTKEKELAKRVLRGEDYWPATHALWFYAPGAGVACKAFWFNQRLSGKFRNHCFYIPDPGICLELYR